MIQNKMKRFNSINVIPLIDVMLVLLAIVLMSASFIVKDSLQIELPETSNTQSYISSPEETPVKLYINKDNQLFIEEKHQNLEEIQQFLTTLNKQKAITLQVDKKTEFGVFVQLIDSLKGQDLTNLTILTKSQSQ